MLDVLCEMNSCRVPAPVVRCCYDCVFGSRGENADHTPTVTAAVRTTKILRPLASALHVVDHYNIRASGLGNDGHSEVSRIPGLICALHLTFVLPVVAGQSIPEITEDVHGSVRPDVIANTVPIHCAQVSRLTPRQTRGIANLQSARKTPSPTCHFPPLPALSHNLEPPFLSYSR